MNVVPLLYQQKFAAMLAQQTGMPLDEALALQQRPWARWHAAREQSKARKQKDSMAHNPLFDGQHRLSW